jgi:plasmid replication initiation protein
MRSVLTAITQINEHTDPYISYELLKSSRAYDRVRFFIDAGAKAAVDSI